MSGVSTVEVELWGPGGGGGAGDATGGGGEGGYLRVEVDVSDIDTLELFPGGAGSNPTGGLGLYDGGNGGDGSNGIEGGGGGAATALRDGTGTELAFADGGGGGGAFGDDADGNTVNSAGGGGARGGAGGDATDASENNDGAAGEGTGNGGDGGNASGSSLQAAEQGSDGGTEAVDNRVTVLEATVGGGNDGDGRVDVSVPNETVDHVSHQSDEAFGERAEWNLRAERADINGLNESLDEGVDEVFLKDDGTGTDVFGGLLKDVKRDRAIVTLVVESFEKHAERAEPTSSSEVWQDATDTTVVKDAVDAVSQLTQGTINAVAGRELSFAFHHVTQARKLRAVAEAAGAEVEYQPDKTVDYVDRIGSDKRSITLAPEANNFRGVTVDFKGGEKVTHLRMLGGGKGADQIATDVVADSWSSGDTKRWRTVSLREVTTLPTLREQGETLVNDMDTPETVVIGWATEDVVELGDRFTVKYDAEDLTATEMRAVRVERYHDTEAGLRFKVEFSDQPARRQFATHEQAKQVGRYAVSEGSYKGVDRRAAIERRLATR